MLLRLPVQNNMDWCVRTHISTQIGDITWTRCGIFPRAMQDDEVYEFLQTPEELNENTKIYVGIDTVKKKYTTAEEKRARQREYNRRYKERHHK